MPLVRIIMHWSAGGHTANSSDRTAYHEIVEGDGNRVLGVLAPEANNSTADGVYARHTRKFNTGSIGLSMASMAGAQESPFKKGTAPITPEQLRSFADMCYEYMDTYDIPLSRQTVLSHSEVPFTHGIAQPGKWDINWLPGMAKPDHPLTVGDRIRAMISAASSRTLVAGWSGGADQDLAERISGAVLTVLTTANGGDQHSA